MALTSADPMTRANDGRCIVQGLNGESGSSLVGFHELAALPGRQDIINILEDAAAPLVKQVQQAERARTAIAQHEFRNRATKLGIISCKGCRRHTVLKHVCTQNPGINDGLTQV